MTIDVNLKTPDDDFFDALEDIMEESMVQLFITHPKDEAAVRRVQTLAAGCAPLFYTVPSSLYALADSKCVGISVLGRDDLVAAQAIDKPVFVEEPVLEDTFISTLASGRGVVLNATKPYPELPDFLVALGAENVTSFNHEQLAAMDMDAIALQSGYPEGDFDGIYTAVKVISDAMFRPEQSIVARATKRVLEMTGLR